MESRKCFSCKYYKHKFKFIKIETKNKCSLFKKDITPRESCELWTLANKSLLKKRIKMFKNENKSLKKRIFLLEFEMKIKRKIGELV